MKVVNALTYDWTKVPGETNTKPSLTVPDATMSLRELLDRYGRGLPVNGSEPVYHGEEVELPNLRAMDLTEIQALREASAEQVKNLQEQATNESNTKKAAKEAASKKKQRIYDAMEKQLEQADAKPAVNE